MNKFGVLGVDANLNKQFLDKVVVKKVKELKEIHEENGYVVIVKSGKLDVGLGVEGDISSLVSRHATMELWVYP